MLQAARHQARVNICSLSGKAGTVVKSVPAFPDPAFTPWMQNRIAIYIELRGIGIVRTALVYRIEADVLNEDKVQTILRTAAALFLSVGRFFSPLVWRRILSEGVCCARRHSAPQVPRFLWRREDKAMRFKARRGLHVSLVGGSILRPLRLEIKSSASSARSGAAKRRASFHLPTCCGVGGDGFGDCGDTAVFTSKGIA